MSNLVAGLRIFDIFELYAVDMEDKESGSCLGALAMAGQDYSDPDIVDQFMELYDDIKFNQAGQEYLNHQVSKMIPEGREGVAITFEDPLHPNDPEYAVTVYALFADEQKKALKYHAMMAGAKANFVMVYKKPCCPKLSYVVDLKDGDRRFFALKDNPTGTMDNHKNFFYALEENGNEELQKIPAIWRGFTSTEVRAHMKNGVINDPKQNPQNEISHRFLHAKGADHHCHSNNLRYTPPELRR